MNKYVRKALRGILWLLVGIVSLVVLVLILIQVPYVQNLGKDKVARFLENKLKTTVSIGNLSVDFPKRIVLQDVYFEDQAGDTLLYGDTIKVDLYMMKLLSNQVVINEIDLRGITGFITRPISDSTYNFDYIIRAFVREEKRDVPLDSTAAMKFSLSKINLDRIRLRMNDEVIGTDMALYLRHFDTKIKDFDLDNKKFRIPKITLSGINATLLQTKALSKEAVTTDTFNMAPAFTYPDIELGEIDFSDIHIDYDNTITAIDSKLDLGSLLIEFEKLDLPNQQIDVRVINLENTDGRFALGETAQEAVEATAEEVAEVMEKGWTVHLSRLGLKEIDFKFDDLTRNKIPRGIDYSHIDLKDINAEATEIFYNTDTLTGRIKTLSLTESSGLDLKNFQGDVFYGHNEARLDNYVLQTSRSHMSDQVGLTYTSLEAISDDIGKMGIDAHFDNSRLAVFDLLLFAPSLARQEPFRGNQNATIFIDGHVNGRIGDLAFSQIELSGLGNIRLSGSGRIVGLPDVADSYFDLNIGHFSASGSDLRGLLPAGSLPSNVRIPESISLKGTFKGTFKAFTTNMNVNSSFGSAHVNGTLKNLSSKQNAFYDVKIRSTKFDIGRLLSMEDKIGTVSVDANIRGTGMDPKTANAKFDGVISEVHYNGYTYHNVTLNGTANNGDIEMDGSINDPNANLDFHAVANMTGEYPSLNLTMDLDSINLHALNFYEKDLRIHGKINADLQTADPDYLNGTINVADMILVINGKRYALDTISIVSVATPGEDSLELRSEFLTLHMKGQYTLTDVFPALQGTINKYFNTSPAVIPPVTYEPQKITFRATVIRSPLIEALLPDLTEMRNATITGDFDSSTGEINIDGTIPGLQYKEFAFNDVGFGLHTENDALNYAITLERINNKQFQVLNASLSGKAQNDILDVKLLVQDAEEKDQYKVAGEFKSVDRHFEFSMMSDGLLLNYQPWNVAPDNVIRFGKEGLLIRNFKISNGQQSMLVNSNPQQVNAPVEINFDDFKIETLTRLVTKDSLFAGGTMNGMATLRDIKTNLVFTSDLVITDFSFHGDTVGNIALKVNNETANTYAADVRITGYGNEVNFIGYYYVSGDQSNYDLNVDIVRLNMKSIEGFTMGTIDGSSGSISGDLAIKGTLAKPSILGEIHFNDARFMVTKFNSYYTARDETMRFTSEGLVLERFTLVDTFGNVAVLNGRILTEDFRDFGFDMTLNADNFQVLNSTRYNNKIYYGPMFVDARLRVGGGFYNPFIDGSIRVNDKTKLTIVIPQNDPGIVEREGIVEFIDMDTIQYTILATAYDSLTQTEWTGLDVAVNITIDKDAELSLIIDEANGDYLNIKGEANLTGGIDPSGKITLTGLYELDEGSYSFSFNQLKREFKIKQGSSLLWTGEPLTADVNVVAVYKAETAPLSLVQNQLGDSEQNIVNTYKQKLPFDIVLTMTGRLLEPDVTFDIQLPEGNHGVSSEVVSTVQSRLAQIRLQPSELNKQVFAVLLLNRFISEDPFQNEARSGGVSSMARQSASRLLSEQLNNLVGGFIAGFDLTFDINSIEDYTTGELQNRTDLTVGLSKRLLDDRLKVSIGSNFELEGPQETDRKATNIAGDISVEYQLSKDGRYMLRAYRKDEYIIVQGQVVETGVGFVFTADYEKFKDLFAKKTEEQKQLKRDLREERREERNGTE